MANKVYEINPDYVTKPGDILSETLDSLNMTRSNLANKAGVTSQQVAHAISGEQLVTLSFANKLEIVLKVPASFWMNLETNYRKFLQD